MLIKTQHNGLIRRKDEVILGNVGEGLQRKLILKGSKHNKCSDKEKEIYLFARGCLANALILLNSSDFSFVPSNPPSENELNRLKTSILISLAFVNLSLCDYRQALQHAHDALKLSPTGYQKVLSHLYAGEALVWLDQISEAIGHFNPEMISNEISNASNNADGEAATPTWFPNTVKWVLLYNLAVAYTLRGELDKAAESLKQVGSNANSANDTAIPVHVFMLSIYIQLQQGCYDVAKTIIRQLPQYR